MHERQTQRSKEFGNQFAVRIADVAEGAGIAQEKFGPRGSVSPRARIRLDRGHPHQVGLSAAWRSS